MASWDLLCYLFGNCPCTECQSSSTRTRSGTREASALVCWHGGTFEVSHTVCVYLCKSSEIRKEQTSQRFQVSTATWRLKRTYSHVAQLSVLSEGEQYTLTDTAEEILETCSPQPSVHILTQPGKSTPQPAGALLPCLCPALPVLQAGKIKLS